MLCSSIKYYKTHLCFFLATFFFSFFKVSSQKFLRRFSRLKIVHHVSRVRRVRAAVPHRQGTYSSRFPKTTTTTTTIVVVFAPFFLSPPSFFFQRQSALKVVSLSIAKQKRTLWTCRSSLSLSLSLHIRNKAPSRDFEASRRKRQTSPPRRAWRER